MKIFLLSSLLLTTPLLAEEAPEKGAAAIVENKTGARSFFMIDPKSRSADFVQAFELLRKEKPTLKISVRTSSGAVFPNVTDLSASEKGTLMLLKVLSNQGSKLLILPVEEVAEIAYSP